VRFSQRGVRIMLFALIAAMFLGFVLAFMPGGWGGFFTGQRAGVSEVVLRVNGDPITSLDVSRFRQTSGLDRLPVSSVALARDLEYLTAELLVRNALLTADAKGVRVDSRMVADTIRDFRQANGLTSDRDYKSYLSSVGFTEPEFRGFVEATQRINQRREQLVADVTVTDEEARLYYELHPEEWQHDTRYVAWQITVEDYDLAVRIRGEATAGGDFAALAAEYSTSNQDVGGAINADEAGNPRPVSALFLGPEMGDAIARLEPGAVSPVVYVGAHYALVKLEGVEQARVPPFEEAAGEVRDFARRLKQAGVLEDYEQRLRREAVVEVVRSDLLRFENPVVARVGEREIRWGELSLLVYGDQQVQQLLAQPGLQDIILNTAKQLLLATIVDQEIARAAVAELGLPLIGSGQQLRSDIARYVTRDVQVTDTLLREVHESIETLDRYGLPRRARVYRASFDTEEAAREFHAEVRGGAPFRELAEERSTVKPVPLGVQAEGNSLVLTGALSEAVFAAVNLPRTQGGELTDVISANGQYHVFWIFDREARSFPAFEAVRADLERDLLNERRQARASEWLRERREDVTVENYLEELTAEFIARVEAEERERLGQSGLGTEVSPDPEAPLDGPDAPGGN
jgi:parvulin-like peptidyl-prolyl isomerase